MTPRFSLAQLDALDPVRCPCGWARRAFAEAAGGRVSVHQVDIEVDARTHYHKTLTEIYIVLEGEGWMELDGERFPLRPLAAVLIHPGCRHRATGKLRILNVVLPAFDPKDEWFD